MVSKGSQNGSRRRESSLANVGAAALAANAVHVPLFSCPIFTSQDANFCAMQLTKNNLQVSGKPFEESVKRPERSDSSPCGHRFLSPIEHAKRPYF
jgi:hypothetical protein